MLCLTTEKVLENYSLNLIEYGSLKLCNLEFEAEREMVKSLHILGVGFFTFGDLITQV